MAVIGPSKTGRYMCSAMPYAGTTIFQIALMRPDEDHWFFRRIKRDDPWELYAVYDDDDMPIAIHDVRCPVPLSFLDKNCISWTVLGGRTGDLRSMRAMLRWLAKPRPLVCE
jgi:hypothetical protein